MSHDRVGGRFRDSVVLAFPGAPHPATLYAWTRRHPAFATEIAAAKRFRDAMLVDRILDTDARDGALRKRLGQLSGGAKRRED